jgi:primosomal protein N' (replication factor Y) (superfamily II helicase)
VTGERSQDAVARVHPLVTARAVDHAFDYLVPGPLRDAVARGALVEVELGSRAVRGVVTEVRAGDGEGLKEVLRVQGAVPEQLLALAEWIAATYASTLPRAVGLVIPPPAGARAPDPWVRLVTMEGATRRQAEVLAHVGLAPLPLSDLVAACGTTRETVRRMAKRGLVALDPAPRAPADDVRVTLTPEQELAVAACAEALAGGGGDVLVHGVTGSGKTEVYLRAIDAALGQGRGAIVLVPEIALTPQTAARFTARFGHTVAVLHSGISPARRGAEHARIAAGDARVVVGARSAIFAAVPDLGVIVVDEEHDASYKHEADPRYDARTIAAKRAALEGAVAVFGSATPRPESWAALEHLELGGRLGADLPPVQVIDLRREAGYPLSAPLLRALRGVAERRGKAILLLNRRGVAPALHCRACGTTIRCPNCDVSLVLHGDTSLRCHHCGFERQAPSTCEACGSPEIARLGAGTQKLERELERELPELELIRLDADAVAKPEQLAKSLARFRDANGAVLLGTQMVAKGHHFAGVELAAVVDADTGLGMPDFRAEERTFQLITQLAGRSGRDAPGRVLVQSFQPDARPIVYAARHDVARFLTEELERRKELGYPPFSHLVRIVVAGHELDPVLRALDELKAGIAGADLLGPAALLRLRGRYRGQLVAKTSHPRRIASQAARLLAAAAPNMRKAKLTAVVDVDPQSL